MGAKLYSDGSPDTSSDNAVVDGLKIIIVGGGIGGLTAALALRQQGHRVDVYEHSGFSREVGAALHTGPNGNGVLKRLGISCKDVGADVVEWISEWTPGGEKSKQMNVMGLSKAFEHKWRCAHRIKLHETLMKAATADHGVGKPAILHLSKTVSDIDTAKAVIYFKDGGSAQGDVVIGADGIHSVTRTKLPGGDMQPFPSGQSAFRFLIPRDKVLADPRTRRFAELDCNFNGFLASDRSIIMYPTYHNTLLNFVCIHPDSESESTEGWGKSAGRSKLIDVYREFHSDVKALLEMADEDSLKVWQLLDMSPVPKWYHERLAVIGDAAHPFMPFLGQGASIAIEDAVAMAVVLEPGLKREEIPERLKLYQDIRKVRAELVQDWTRISGRQRGETKSFDLAKYQGYCFGWNEWDHSAQMLREWKWARLPKSVQPMKTVFGPITNTKTITPDVAPVSRGPSFTMASIRFSTSRPILDGLLPPGNKSFRFKSPASIAQCTFRHIFYSGSPKTGESGYSRLGLYIHNVEYEQTDGQIVAGAFLPIMFEDMVDSVKIHRADDGVPSVSSAISIERDRTSFHIRASSEGLTWGTFYLDGLEPIEPAINGGNNDESVKTDPSSSEGLLYHQYLSQGDSQQQSERTVFIPAESTTAAKVKDVKNLSISENGASLDEEGDSATSVTRRIWRAKSANFKLNARDPDAFPSLYHIISRLQEIHVRDIIEATVIEGSGKPELMS